MPKRGNSPRNQRSERTRQSIRDPSNSGFPTRRVAAAARACQTEPGMAGQPQHLPARARITTPRPSLAPSLGVRRGPAPSALAIYGLLSLITLGIAFARDKNPIETTSWLEVLPSWSRHILSVVGGSALAVITVRATRVLVRHWKSAKLLHSDLRPV